MRFIWIECRHMREQFEYWNYFAAGALIAPGDVYMICHSQADPLILAECDEFHELSDGSSLTI